MNEMANVLKEHKTYSMLLYVNVYLQQQVYLHVIQEMCIFITNNKKTNKMNLEKITISRCTSNLKLFIIIIFFYFYICLDDFFLFLDLFPCSWSVDLIFRMVGQHGIFAV